MKFTKIVLVVSISALIAGCTKSDIRIPKGKSPTFDLTPTERVQLALRVKDKPIELSEDMKAVVETNKGVFSFILYSYDAPKTVANFVRLAKAGFYDGLIWHRHIGGFIIQGGDPLGTGEGSAGYRIEFEENGKSNVEGAVGMARGEEKNSASCQFYICLAPNTQIDGEFCVFGQITEGMDVVKGLFAGNDSAGIPPDTIRRILIVP
ncbi:peptidylprolyl isomerase [candidate division WOR-3 bacterium]|nr:peptidylprolyl isomerase [candidate division WOR-3 bacterium]